MRLLPIATSCHPESPCLSLEETKGVRIDDLGKTLIQGALEACSVPKDQSLTERVAQEACKSPAPCVTSVSVRGPISAAMCVSAALQDPLPHLHRGCYPALNLIYSIPLRLSALRNAPLTSPPETHMPLLLESAPEIHPLPPYYFPSIPATEPGTLPRWSLCTVCHFMIALVSLPYSSPVCPVVSERCEGRGCSFSFLSVLPQHRACPPPVPTEHFQEIPRHEKCSSVMNCGCRCLSELKGPCLRWDPPESREKAMRLRWSKQVAEREQGPGQGSRERQRKAGLPLLGMSQADRSILGTLFPVDRRN